MVLCFILGIVRYNIDASGSDVMNDAISVTVLDKHGNSVGSALGAQGSIEIQNANFWWPYTMTSDEPAYLYTLQVILKFCW